jgi:hypothetical protein
MRDLYQKYELLKGERLMATRVGYGNYIDFMQKIHRQEPHPYLHRSKKSRSYALFPDKKKQNQDGTTYEPLTHRHIVLLSRTYKEDIQKSKEDLDLVIAESARMRQAKIKSDHKQLKQSKLSKLTYFISILYDRCQNLRSGYRWKTTATIEMELLRSLQQTAHHLKNIPKNNPSRAEQKNDKVEIPKEDEKPLLAPTVPPEKETLPIQKEISSPKKAPPRPFLKKATPVDLYRQNPKHGNRISKLNLFNSIGSIESLPNQSGQHSFENLLKDLCQEEDIILEGICAYAVQDMYRHGSKEAQDKLSLWLKKQASFGPELFIACLEVLNKKYTEQAISDFAIIELLHIYQEKLWPEVSVGNPAIVKSMEILIEISIDASPNYNRVVALVEWMAKQPTFNQETCQKWLKILDAKEQRNQESLLNPMREILERMHPNWCTPRPERVIPRVAAPLPEIKVKKAVDPDDNVANDFPWEKETLQKKQALKDYKTSLSQRRECKQKSKIMAFGDIKFVKIHPYSTCPERGVTSVTDLLLFVHPERKIDLSHSSSQAVIFDLIQHSTTSLKDRTIEWLCQEPTFCPEMLTSAVSSYVGNCLKNPITQLHGMRMLLLSSHSKQWQKADFTDFSPLITALSILIKESPEEQQTIKVAEALKNQLSPEEIDNMLAILDQKEKEHRQKDPHLAPIQYALRGVLQKKGP